MCVVDSKSDTSLTSQERMQRVRRRFDAAAANYDKFAEIQKTIASDLANQVAGATKSRTLNDGLEIGCGTGFLTEHLLGLDSQARWMITDLSSKMVARCRERLRAQANSSEVDYRVVDGQAVDIERRFDLICSNLTFQWFDRLADSIANLYRKLQPNGLLIFNLLGNGSFQPWCDAYSNNSNAPCPPEFMKLEELESSLELALDFDTNASVRVQHGTFVQEHAGLRSFFKSLKKIGANTQLQQAPSDFGQLKSWLATNNQDPVAMNYEVFSVIISKRTAMA